MQQLFQFKLTTKKAWNIHITGPLRRDSTGDRWFPTQRVGNAESVSMPDVIMLDMLISGLILVQGEGRLIDSISLQWRHNGSDGVSNNQPPYCLFNRLFRSKKTPKLRVTGLCAGNSPVIGEFPAQMTSNAKNVSIWWCHYGKHPVCRPFYSIVGEWLFFQVKLKIDILINSSEIGHRWVPRNPVDDKTVDSGKGLVPSGNKPLPEPVLTQIYMCLWVKAGTFHTV